MNMPPICNDNKTGLPAVHPNHTETVLQIVADHDEAVRFAPDDDQGWHVGGAPGSDSVAMVSCAPILAQLLLTERPTDSSCSPSSSVAKLIPWNDRAPRNLRSLDRHEAPRSLRTSDLGPFLAATPMCDADHAAVRRIAAEVTRRARTRRDAAVALFYWVRDQIAYTMGDWNWRASETLALRSGTCSNKANLMVAMARAIGIPAGFHVQYATTPSYFSGGFIPMVQRIVRDKAIHVYVALFLQGRWVKCDPTDDKALSDAIEAIVPHARAFDFDGENDAVIRFAPGSVLSDRGPFPDIDAELSRDSRLGDAHKRMFQAYIAYLREFGARYRRDSHDERLRIEADFCRCLAESEPQAYAELMAEPLRAAA